MPSQASAPDEAGLSVTSAQVQEATAESLDGSSTMVKNPGNLADLRDEAYFGWKLPAGSADTDKHSASSRIFALKTVGGGVLVFYALAAQLTLAPPPGQTFEVSIPGYYSSSQTLTSATIGYGLRPAGASAAGVVPVHPGAGDLIRSARARTGHAERRAGPAALGLVQAHGGLRQGVIQGIPDRANQRREPFEQEGLGEVHRGVLRPRVGVVDHPAAQRVSCRARSAAACRTARSTNAVSLLSEHSHPAISPANASTTSAVYPNPPPSSGT